MKGGEIIQIIEQIAKLSDKKPVIIFTGGNPLMHPDFAEIIEKTRKLGFSYSISISATDLLTPNFLLFLEKESMHSISMSIDGIPTTHDIIRNKKGSFRKTVEMISFLRAEGVKVQVNTTIMKRNYNELPFILHTIRKLDIKIWELFFLITTGRGESEESISPEDAEDVLKYLYLLKLSGFIIRTVEAPEIRRIEKEAIENGTIKGGLIFEKLLSDTMKLDNIDLKKAIIPDNFKSRRKTKTLFISSTGDVMISGLFNAVMGNLRIDRMMNILSYNKLILEIEDKRNLKGSCSNCRYLEICGGSRARAFNVYGDYLESDPLCMLVKGSS
jgi:radical SAM protein with 4Fe4S-binding SPASM domain